MRLDETNYVTMAEKAVDKLPFKTDKYGNKKIILTTSKIRNLLAMTSDIYNDVVNMPGDKLAQETVGRINYLKIRFIYEAGREIQVKELVEKADLITHLAEIGNSKKQFILFSRYMEALVAYRKFKGGKDE